MADGMPGLGLRQPPTNLPAEQALLGGLLANNKAYDAIAGRLQAEHFADPAHGAIYAAIARRIDAGRLADAVTLDSASVEWAGGFETVAESRAYLGRLLACMVGSRDVAHYADAVIDCWHRRELIRIGQELVGQAMDPGEMPAREIHEGAEEALARLADGQEGDAAPVPAHRAMELAIDEAWKARGVAGGLVGISTGLQALDDLTGGLQPADFYLLAARPSMGKTTLGLTISAGATQAGARVAFISYEMSAVALGAQLTAGVANLSRNLTTRGKERYQDDLGRFRWRQGTEGELVTMQAAQRAMVERRLLILDRLPRTVPALRAALRRLVRRGGLDLVVIDYLGLMTVPELARAGNRVLEVTRLSGDIKAMAKEFRLPFLVLSQLSREAVKGEVKRPQLEHLRDSGALEQDADGVMFLHRDHYYLSREKLERREKETAEDYANRLTRHGDKMNAAEGRAELFIDKLRKGRTGTVPLAYGEETTWFSDLPETAP